VRDVLLACFVSLARALGDVEGALADIPYGLELVHAHRASAPTQGESRNHGEMLEQWQYEVTAGGRIWYCMDDGRAGAISFG
jgi:hypothetical protein